MEQLLANLIDLEQYPLQNLRFRSECKHKLEEKGVLVLPGFLKPDAITCIQKQGKEKQHLAYYAVNKHNIYLCPSDPQYSDEHPRNRQVSSSKGCITTDQIPSSSLLNTVYDNSDFRDFLCKVLNENSLYEYADNMSSINLHYASKGQELGWHYDNSSFAITLMIQTPEKGGVFEYVKDARNADLGEMNYALSEKILDGQVVTKALQMEAGSLVLFRGRNSIHRVTPVLGDRTRMLVVLAYNTEPNVSLSESARMTFYGRLG